MQHPDGLLPRDGDTVTGDRAERFAAHHHPATVAAFAGTLALARLTPRL
ncbi:hypothetical protein [Saccharothrix texasensis]|nr:hypothetical protein [Saccharothrix texasensis]